MDTSTSPLSSIGIDIGKEVFHIVGFSTNRKVAFRRKGFARGSLITIKLRQPEQFCVDEPILNERVECDETRLIGRLRGKLRRAQTEQTGPFFGR